jgi:hypothetical protein
MNTPSLDLDARGWKCDPHGDAGERAGSALVASAAEYVGGLGWKQQREHHGATATAEEAM